MTQGVEAVMSEALFGRSIYQQGAPSVIKVQHCTDEEDRKPMASVHSFNMPEGPRIFKQLERRPLWLQKCRNVGRKMRNTEAHTKAHTVYGLKSSSLCRSEGEKRNFLKQRHTT